jgi:hypothetical protein
MSRACETTQSENVTLRKQLKEARELLSGTFVFSDLITNGIYYKPAELKPKRKLHSPGWSTTNLRPG